MIPHDRGCDTMSMRQRLYGLAAVAVLAAAIMGFLAYFNSRSIVEAQYGGPQCQDHGSGKVC